MLGKLSLVGMLCVVAQVPTCGGGGGNNNPPPPKSNDNQISDDQGDHNPNDNLPPDEEPPPDEDPPPNNDQPDKAPPEPVEQETVCYLQVDRFGTNGGYELWEAANLRWISLDPPVVYGIYNSKGEPPTFLVGTHTEENWDKVYPRSLFFWLKLDLGTRLPGEYDFGPDNFKEILEVRLELYCTEVGPAGPGEMVLRRAKSETGKDRFEDVVTVPTPKRFRWCQIDITNLYKSWQAKELANFGFQVTPVRAVEGEWTRFFAFPYGESEYVDDTHYLPHLVFKFRVPQGSLFLPLKREGPDQYEPPYYFVSGYHFGAQWESKYCLDGVTSLLHTGVDFGGWYTGPGDYVYAAQTGIVRYLHFDQEWGGYIVVEHDGLTTAIYEHTDPLITIHVGDRVRRGEIIGRLSRLPFNNEHLHFQWRDIPFDPNDLNGFLRGRLPEESCITEDSLGKLEPAFPNHFVNPLLFDWSDE